MAKKITFNISGDSNAAADKLVVINAAAKFSNSVLLRILRPKKDTVVDPDPEPTPTVDTFKIIIPYIDSGTTWSVPIAAFLFDATASQSQIKNAITNQTIQLIQLAAPSTNSNPAVFEVPCKTSVNSYVGNGFQPLQLRLADTDFYVAKKENDTGNVTLYYFSAGSAQPGAELTC